jgi:hypothetical protein
MIHLKFDEILSFLIIYIFINLKLFGLIININ